MYLQTYLKQNKPLKVKRGSRTKAYIFSDKVLLRTCDPVKEVMAHGWFPESELFPEIKLTDFEDLDDTVQIYESPVYLQGSVRKIVCSDDYEEVYLPLSRMYKTMYRYWSHNNYDWHQNFITSVKACEGLRDGVGELLIQAYEACMNMSYKVKFEISPRNVAATEDGKLILLDCFFIV